MSKQTSPRLEAKKIYLKDVSFESPSSPLIFSHEDLQPKIDVRMDMSHARIDATPDYYEVVLKITASASQADETLFLAEVHQAGVFAIVQSSTERLARALEIACPHMLLPFAREEVASLVGKSGFPQLLISPVNFETIFEQKRKKAAAADATGTDNGTDNDTGNGADNQGKGNRRKGKPARAAE